jgi:anti-sigma regulatory factor (Ser/Thr protein kinase)
MVPFVHEGIDRGEPVLVAVGRDRLNALRGELGSRERSVEWAPTDEWHPHPAQRLRAFHQLVTREVSHGTHGVRLAEEPVWPHGPPEFVLEWERYESVLNHVLGPFPVTLVCTYDTTQVDPAVIANVRRTHRVIHAGHEHTSDEYVEPVVFLRESNHDVEPPPPTAVAIHDATDLGSARRVLARQAAAAGLDEGQIADLCLAATEILTNAIVHGGGDIRCATWMHNGRFICQIDDEGMGVSDPMAGYIPPDPEEIGGRGCWLARQLIDLLQIAPTNAGTSVRLHAVARASG